LNDLLLAQSLLGAAVNELKWQWKKYLQVAILAKNAGNEILLLE
jgi:hypothetical protein